MTGRFDICQWLHAKIGDPLVQIIRRGAEPKQLAFSTALGLTLGIFPICGISLCMPVLVWYVSVYYGSRTKPTLNLLHTPIVSAIQPNTNGFKSWHVLQSLRCMYFRGTTVILCGVAIAILGGRCNPAATMLFNFVATPIELSLIIPFLRLGEAVSGGPHFELSPDAFKKVITGHASKEVLFSILHAILGWLIATPFILLGLYIIFLPCYKFLVQRFAIVPTASRPRSPTSPAFSHAEIKLKREQQMEQLL